MCGLSRNSARSKGLSRPIEGALFLATLQKAVSWISAVKYGSRFADNCRGTRLSRRGTSIGYLLYWFVKNKYTAVYVRSVITITLTTMLFTMHLFCDGCSIICRSYLASESGTGWTTVTDRPANIWKFALHSLTFQCRPRCIVQTFHSSNVSGPSALYACECV